MDPLLILIQAMLHSFPNSRGIMRRRIMDMEPMESPLTRSRELFPVLCMLLLLPPSQPTPPSALSAQNMR
jgi:hypothetical protein